MPEIRVKGSPSCMLVPVRFTEDEHARLERAAAMSGQPLASLVRDLALEALDERPVSISPRRAVG